MSRAARPLDAGRQAGEGAAPRQQQARAHAADPSTQRLGTRGRTRDTRRQRAQARPTTPSGAKRRGRGRGGASTQGLGARGRTRGTRRQRAQGRGRARPRARLLLVRGGRGLGLACLPPRGRFRYLNFGKFYPVILNGNSLL